MEKIAVVTDTGSNLSFAQAKELGIYLLPLQITIDETTYQDTLEISTQDIYNELANGKMPKTSMAAYQKIYDLFEELKKDYDTIFAVPLTNGLSTNASTMIPDSSQAIVTPILVLVLGFIVSIRVGITLLALTK